MPKAFDLIAAEVTRIARINPETEYQSEDHGVCYYTRGHANGNVGCIFGQAFSNLGYPLDEIHADEVLGTTFGIDEMLAYYGIETPDHIAHAFNETQTSQDIGIPFGEAARPLFEMGY